MTRRLSDEWQELDKQGEAPPATGRSAAEAARDRKRKRRLMPTERRRRHRKVSPTLSTELIDQLRRICRGMGYVDEEGQGVLASPVVERFLWLAVDAYEQGLIEQYEEQVTMTTQSLRWKV